ncbi:MAG: hypothetical protein QXX08_08650 [Candidatus Bathyarchaeia archaeon]
MSVPVSTGFTTAFWLTIISAGICAATPLYYKKFISTTATTITKT